MLSNRDSFEIAASILKAARYGAAKSEIMDAASISYDQLCRYLDLLTATKMVEALSEDGKLYHMTMNGRRFLDSYARMSILINAPRYVERGYGR
jgi:predicted transcriptional regulator